jgi:hypothetical protein
MRGNLDLTLGGVGFQGDLAGFVDGLRAFSAEGSGTVGFKGKGLGGEGLVSSVGAAACGKGLFGLSAGFGVRWENFPQPTIMALSCGIGDWRVAGPARASAGRAGGASSGARRRGPASSRAGQTGGRSFRVRRGTPQLTLSAVGAGAPPAVTLRGPGGVTLSAPATGATLEDGRLAFRNEADATSYLAVARPRPGRWTLTPDPGSVPVLSYRSAEVLPPVRVRARVTGRGGTRRLRWRVSRRRGLRVNFYERSAAGVRRIAVTRGGRGSERFRPAATGRPRRRIIANDRAARSAGRSAGGRPLQGQEQAARAPRPPAGAAAGLQGDRALQPVTPRDPPRGASADLGWPDAPVPPAPPAPDQGGRGGPPRPRDGHGARPRRSGPNRPSAPGPAAPLTRPAQPATGAGRR